MSLMKLDTLEFLTTPSLPFFLSLFFLTKINPPLSDQISMKTDTFDATYLPPSTQTLHRRLEL